MKKHIKLPVTRSEIEELQKNYDLEQLEAAIFARRNIKNGSDIMFFLEKDLRYMHQPFCFNNMEDAVERINSAIEEDEKILIFGDRDVDGITSTAILYNYLKSQGLDVSYRLPAGEEPYGLSIPVIEKFSKEYGSLIITVDCGISNFEEVEYANSLGIDVIVTDHHNPQDKVPEAIVIIDPKTENSGYPYKNISGAAVAFKLVQALRFSKTDFYNQEFTLLEITENEENYTISCTKVRNLIKNKTLSFKAVAGEKISDTPLPEFLKGQAIFVWNKEKTSFALKQIFGNAVEFQTFDLQAEMIKLSQSFSSLSLKDLAAKSKIAKYTCNETSETDAFYNIFVTYIEMTLNKFFPKNAENVMQDLQLVAVAALADIMPMKNENRIFVTNALSSINAGKVRTGLAELLARFKLNGKSLTSSDLSWKIIPALNSSGRMGQTDISLKLLISENPEEREMLADKIIELNEQRKTFVSEGEFYMQGKAQESLNKFNSKICLIADEKINRGITGILAGRFMQKYNIPSIAIAFSEDGQTATGSMRSCRGCIATDFLSKLGDIFINYGGHDYAAGFSIKRENLDFFIKKVEEISSDLQLNEEEDTVCVDAELSAQFINPELLNLIDKFEPYGEENHELKFYSKALQVHDAAQIGKGERSHLKLNLNTGSCIFPAIFWGEGSRLNQDFAVGDKLNILYTVNRNTYKGNVTPQIIIIDAEPSKN